jgi:hypothetical protein
MKTPNYEETHEQPLTTNDDVLDRVKLLVRNALRRQLWLMFLDGDDRQLPVLMPTDVPANPGTTDASNLARFIHGVNDDLDATSIVVTLERRGSDEISDDDRAWFRLVRDACAMAELTLRGPVLVHTRGARWVAAEDYALLD